LRYAVSGSDGILGQKGKTDRMSDAPLFDPSVYSALCSELGAEDAAEVLQAFLSDTPRKIGVMLSAMEDRVAIKRAAHSIKSSAATFGFTELSALARDLESGIEGMTASRLQECVEALHQAFEKAAEFARANVLRTAY
jgi:HPt (histidine-containing phosphotransfer) domain-containing protein